jgi:Asp-tRNA(Asn)/Glu-tRNA(Gln) amidotransferase B subunit
MPKTKPADLPSLEELQDAKEFEEQLKRRAKKLKLFEGETERLRLRDDEKIGLETEGRKNLGPTPQEEKRSIAEKAIPN